MLRFQHNIIEFEYFYKSKKYSISKTSPNYNNLTKKKKRQGFSAKNAQERLISFHKRQL